MSIVPITTTIITGSELAVKVDEVAKQLIPEPPKNLTAKPRWIQCTLKNETQFDLLLEDTHFDAGRYWTAPGSFSGFRQLVFSGCSGDGTLPAGVAGGCAFRVALDDKHFEACADGQGWTNPERGPYQAGVVQSGKGADGLNAATAAGGSLTSNVVFEGKDKEGKPARFRIHVSAAPGVEALFVVKQILVA